MEEIAQDSRLHPYLILGDIEEARRQLVLDYWSGNYEGKKWKWSHSVASLIQREQMGTPFLTQTVISAANAFDSRETCEICSKYRPVTSRNDIVGGGWALSMCKECREQQRKDYEQQLFLKAEKIRKREVDYSNLDTFSMIVVFTLFSFSDGLSVNPECSFRLASSAEQSLVMLDNCRNIGILNVDPYSSSRKPSWVITKPAGQTVGQFLTNLSDEFDLPYVDLPFSDVNTGINTLWWWLARADAFSFLNESVATYNLPKYKAGEQTEAAINHLLKHYSIPQARRVIQSVVKNAASLAMRRDFNHHHALNTIPGRIIGYVDRALSDGWSIFPLLKSWEDESMLITTLFNRVLKTGSSGFKTFSGLSIDNLIVKSSVQNEVLCS